MTGEEIYDRVSPAVVVVHAATIHDKIKSSGSGVVISEKGYIVTNYHVYKGYHRLYINQEGKINGMLQVEKIIAQDMERDILLCKTKYDSFPSIKIGDSDKLKTGEVVYAIGNPLGLGNSISKGLFSRWEEKDSTTMSYILFSAPISPGSSGGALVNSKGELIGITTGAYEEGQNLNRAIPINDVLKLCARNNLVIERRTDEAEKEKPTTLTEDRTADNNSKNNLADSVWVIDDPDCQNSNWGDIAFKNNTGTKIKIICHSQNSWQVGMTVHAGETGYIYRMTPGGYTYEVYYSDPDNDSLYYTGRVNAEKCKRISCVIK